MSTSSKKSTVSAAAAPLKSGKGMSGTTPDDSTPKPGAGGSGDPKPGQDHGPRGDGKKKRPAGG
jgi:hypothetical protein